ncbi:hypothetical protein MED222_06215 [Vibrio sp. MED222]|nr:hypothetical protein MED222_06215 [Vibrio sp. MED222]
MFCHFLVNSNEVLRPMRLLVFKDLLMAVYAKALK